MTTLTDQINNLPTFSSVNTNEYIVDGVALKAALLAIVAAMGAGNGGLQALVDAATASATAASSSADTATSASSAAATSETNAAGSDADAVAQVALATALKVIVDAYCNADPTVEPEVGHKGVRYYLQQVIDASTLVGTKPSPTISNTQAGAGNYTIQASDLGAKIRCQNTSNALHVIVPRDLWKSPAPDGRPGLNFIEFVKEGDGATFGAVNFAGQAGVQTLPTVAFNDIKSFSTATPPGATTYTYTWPSIPAGVNRRLNVFVQSIYSAADLARSSTLTATFDGTPVSINADVADTTTALFSGTEPVNGNLWSGAIPDAVAAKALVLTYNAPANQLCHILWVVVTQDSAGQEDASGDGTAVNATSVSQTNTPVSSGTGRLMLAMYGFSGADALPVTSTDGGTLQNGKTPLTRTQKDIGFACCAFALPSGAAATHAATTAKSTKACHLGVLQKPGAATPGLTLKSAGGVTAISVDNGQATVELLSDGLTGYLDCD